jgi:lycopene cyclase domain-containing protein
VFNPKYTYLLLDVAVLLFPLLLSFDKKVAFYKTWKALFASILIVGIGFIVWDVLFTKYRVWEFNPEFVSGLYLINLPIEEVLFFIVVPYSTVFIYECIHVYFKNYFPDSTTRFIHWFFIVINVMFIVAGYNKAYTVVNSSIALIILFYLGSVVKWKQLNLFYAAFAVCLLPFAICNGILTSWPILIYNNSQNLSIRMGTIPIEDLFYNFNMIILWCFFYEKFRYKS